MQAVLPHLKEGSSIINTSSVNAYKGNASLIPYTSTKGAEVGQFSYCPVHLHLDATIKVLPDSLTHVSWF